MNSLKCLFAIVFLGLAAIAAFAQNAKSVPLKFADLQKFDPTHSTFQIEGYVLDIYKCPPCPPGAMCKPCIPDNITLTNTDDWKDLSTLRRLRIYTDQTYRFDVKKKYLVTVNVKGTPLAGAAVDSVDLISIDWAAPASTDNAPVGEWKGESNCTVPDSPCHNEIVVYDISVLGAGSMYAIRADKVVNGMREEMGTLNCSFAISTSKLRCEMKNGIWEFVISGKTMAGELRLSDHTLYRKIAVTKTVHN